VRRRGGLSPCAHLCAVLTIALRYLRGSQAAAAAPSPGGCPAHRRFGCGSQQCLLPGPAPIHSASASSSHLGRGVRGGQSAAGQHSRHQRVSARHVLRLSSSKLTDCARCPCCAVPSTVLCFDAQCGPPARSSPLPPASSLCDCAHPLRYPHASPPAATANAARPGCDVAGRTHARPASLLLRCPAAARRFVSTTSPSPSPLSQSLARLRAYQARTPCLRALSPSPPHDVTLSAHGGSQAA